MNTSSNSVSRFRIWNRLPGLVVAVPLVVLLWGTDWSLPIPQHPARVDIISMNQPGMPSRPASLPRLPEGEPAGAPNLLPAEDLLFTFDRPMRDLAVSVQMRGEDKAVLRGGTNTAERTILWEIHRLRNFGNRLVTRSTEIALAKPMRFFHIHPHWSTSGAFISRVRFVRLVPVSHLWLLPFCALAAFLVARGRPAPVARALERGDAFIAAALIFTLFIRLSVAALVLLAVLLLLMAAMRRRRGTRRVPAAALAFNILFLFAFLRIAPAGVEHFIVFRTASEYNLDIDHRMKPDGHEINADGIRFLGSPSDLRDDDFNILFLGDSFAYGMKLAYEDTVPRVFERLAAEQDLRPPVHTVNFGWVSSSPLLSCRLLMDIGAKYKPDLAVLLLDVTDYHDDIKYAAKIAAEEGAKFNSRLLLDNLIDRMLLRFMSVNSVRRLKDSLRPLAVSRREAMRHLSLFTDNRYYATNIPYDQAVPHFRSGVLQNLGLIHAFCRDRLHIPFAVVLVPRAYQYSDRECPRDYEADLYTIRGPWVRNPSRFFEEVAPSLPYPVLDLLPVFEQAEEFPLYFEDDPHWNPAGARLAARNIFDFLAQRRLIPVASGELRD